MVFRRESVLERLKELDVVLQELRRHHDLPAIIRADLSRRWIVERGLIAAASLILDIANHILAEQFAVYTHSYEESLHRLHECGVIDADLYQQIKGLGGFRNVLVHLYQEIDPPQVWESYEKGLVVFPQFAQQILDWLAQLDQKQE
jgi:uncharacterized protein YutE (UPF0331/DUF86 family)